MKTRTLSKILDNLFLILGVFCLSFLWVRYYEHNVWLIVMFSSIATFVICSLVHLISSYKKRKNKIASDENKKISNLTSHFMFQTKLDTIKDFEKTLSTRSLSYKKIANFLIYNDVLIYPIFYKIKVDSDSLLSIILELKSKKIVPKTLVICGQTFTADAKNLCDKFTEYNISLFDSKATYQTFFKPINFEINAVSSSPKKKKRKEKFWNLVCVAFNRQRFKGYFMSSIVLLIASYFMRYSLYYLITSSVLILFALFSYFNKPFNPKQKNIFGE